MTLVLGFSLNTLYLCRYEELKSLAGGLEAEADSTASEADKAYQSSLMLLSSLSRLMKTSFGSFEVRALILRGQAIPFHPAPPPAHPVPGPHPSLALVVPLLTLLLLQLAVVQASIAACHSSL